MVADRNELIAEKQMVHYTICLSSRTHNYSIDHRYWYNIIEFLGHIQRELQAAVASLLESLHYVCTMCILTLIVRMKPEWGELCNCRGASALYDGVLSTMVSK